MHVAFGALQSSMLAAHAFETTHVVPSNVYPAAVQLHVYPGDWFEHVPRPTPQGFGPAVHSFLSTQFEPGGLPAPAW